MSEDTDTPTRDELVAEANERYQQDREEREAFLSAVAEEDGAEVIETHVTLIEGFDVDVAARLDGRLTDTLAAIEKQVKGEEVSAMDVRDTAERTAMLLERVVDEPEASPPYDRDLFMQVYDREGLAALGKMLRRVLEGVKAERERREGVSDGFRATE